MDKFINRIETVNAMLEKGEVIASEEIMFSFVFTERRNGSDEIPIKGYGNARLEVFTNEGRRNAHFHITVEGDGNNNKGFLCAVRLDVPWYFKHGKYQDTLTNKQLKDLIEALKKPSSMDPKISVWRSFVNA